MDRTKLLPKSTIYLHIAEDTLMHGRGPVRAETIGPLAATMLALLVGHTRITLTPVIRPYGDVAVDAYEIPRRIREQVILRDLVEVFPYSARPARNQQLDHTTAYRKGAQRGKPGRRTWGRCRPRCTVRRPTATGTEPAQGRASSGGNLRPATATG